MSGHRNKFFILVSLVAMLLAMPMTATASQFNYADVVAKAKALSEKSFTPPKKIPGFLANLSYNDYRDIRFRTKNSLWKQSNTLFQVQLIHPGLYYDHAVNINVVDAQGVHKVEFSPTLFDYGHNKFESKIPPHLGFAGFKLTYPLNDPDQHNQFLVFAGASYFRAVGRDQQWGLSARGLAIDTGLPIGEEFPFFKTFWLVRPSPDARQMIVYGLLDSQSVTGAYRFVIHPGDSTLMDVKVTLFERKDIKQLGIAPLTSMFFYGEDSARPKGYWRPEVHDSDGLLIHDGTGEWIWRPLADPENLLVSSFSVTNPRGFGLMQRDRNFYDYQDLEAHYGRRPSAWVTPTRHWQNGHVMLVEIPSDKEVNDNIVAFWVPNKTPPPGKPIHFAYTLHWIDQPPEPRQIGQSVATYIGHGDKPGYTRFVLDFNSQPLSKLPAKAKISGVVSVGDGGKLISSHVTKNPETGGWRLGFQIDPPDKPLELRAFLKSDTKTLTETWSFLLTPP